MPKVSDLHLVEIPAEMVSRFGLTPGSDVDWRLTPEGPMLVNPDFAAKKLSLEERLRLFDESSADQERRNAAFPPGAVANDRGWTREDLYPDGGSR